MTTRAMMRRVVVCGSVMVSIVAVAGCRQANADYQPPQQEGIWWEPAESTPPVAGASDGGSWGITQEPFFPPDRAYYQTPLPASAKEYGRLDAARIKRHIEAIAAISRKSRDDGNQYWGRITGTKYDHETTEWVAGEFRRIGLSDVRFQEWPLPTQWYPDSWEVTLTGGGKTINLATAHPWWGSEAAPQMALEPVWVGLGTAADFAGRNVRGKAVLIHSNPTPGGLNNSAGWSGAIQRARDNGAAAVFVILGFPGNLTAFTPAFTGPPWSGRTFSLGMADGNAVRTMIENGQSPRINVRLNVSSRDDMTTRSVWAVLPGATDENILVMAHTEAYFEGALDNASGVGLMLELAEYYASIPQSRRPRTMTFLTTSAHHVRAAEAGIHWVRDNMGEFFERTALIVNCEHAAQTQTYILGPNLIASNVVGARRFFAQGPDEFKAIVTNAFDMFGVGQYSRPAARSGGELMYISHLAPSFHVLADIFYHTDLDIPALVPEAGLASAARAYAKIIDDTNKLDLATLRAGYPMAQ